MIYGTDMGFVAVPGGADYVPCDEEHVGKSPSDAVCKALARNGGEPLGDQDVYLVYRFPAEHDTEGEQSEEVVAKLDFLAGDYVDSAEQMWEQYNDSIRAARKVFVDTLEAQLRADPLLYVQLVATVDGSGEVKLR
jgi:hypothetical protein